MKAIHVSPKHTVWALGLLSAAALLFAIIAEYGFGYAPCDLCMAQRYWHELVVAAGVIMLYIKRPRIFLGLQAFALVMGLGFAAFHIGVEQHWWHGTQACTDNGSGGESVEDLTRKILNTPVARCDEPQWFFLGLSMATYNALLCAAMLTAAVARLVKK